MTPSAAPEIVTVYAVFADRGEADRVGHIIIGEHLAACVNILGQTESIYRWQGKIETASECAALFKTTAQQAETLVRRIAALHSYENPAITVWSIAHAPLSYTQWVKEQVR